MEMHIAVTEYLNALEAGDVEKVVSLFEPQGRVDSPFLGRMPAGEFFPKAVADLPIYNWAARKMP